ncbi:MAG TPA: MurR/RpiR family transcriptional regulator [Anaerolineales bacterium]|jgi:DNA-binding MurR/RpiR family transcriptional regulator|nr:MurR/RpiR family transcriptional regulator [Anaerolineales bacterium]
MASYEERIRSSRAALSPSFIRLADFLLDSYAETAFLTATELAHSLDIDPATVVRFAQKLGYQGYPDLQREIRTRVRRELLANGSAEPDSVAGAADIALDELAKGLELTRRSFPKEQAQNLITALDKAERVILLAEGLAQAPARSLAAWLEAAGYSIHLAGGGVSELARALAGARKGDLTVAIEVVEESPLLARTLASARRAGVRTAALVAAPSSAVARQTDIVLAAHPSPHPGGGQVMVEAMVYALARMLMHARPGRFARVAEQVESLATKLSSGDD